LFYLLYFGVITIALFPPPPSLLAALVTARVGLVVGGTAQCVVFQPVDALSIAIRGRLELCGKGLGATSRGSSLTAMPAEHTECLHLEIEFVAVRRAWVCPDTAFVLMVVIELLALVVHMLGPGLELPVGSTFSFLAQATQFLELRALLVAREVSTTEVHNVLICITVQLF
jgi:hypothetical protein